MTARKIVFVWESFGPSHVDRLAACAADSDLTVLGVELHQASSVYRWERSELRGMDHAILCPADGRQAGIGAALRLVRLCLRHRPAAVFLCHYNLPAIFAAAVALRLLGMRVVTMLDSKFDDYPRNLPREVLKAAMLAPYQAALVASRRSADYVRFLGFRRRPVAQGYDSLDVTRLRDLAAAVLPLDHAKREFLIVARLVEKKNLRFAITAFATWQARAAQPRKLRLIGYGDQEDQLRALVSQLGLDSDIVFEGEAGAGRVAEAMRQSLCLILPSREEQFGLVLTEALAQGLPVLVSGNAGGVDGLIDNGVNGWIVDPYRPAALVAAMELLDRDEAVWDRASAAAQGSAERGDVRHFVEAVKSLI